MLLEEGVIDAVQFHGDETPEQCYKIAYPYYKAVRVRAPGDLKKADEYSCPRVLLDAYSSHARGGTGATVDQNILSAGENRGLWLAGGLGPYNIRKVMNTFSPELVDLSSGLELFPGKKDKEKIARFFKELDNGVL
jgi:indole-3-glycerol phosphate synthase/phosphoribosylanthranilate isomerase